ncbi:MAG: hypothetical protein Q8R92_05205 [Deltaproteobacteria bacterium]|nr:hypothetical protein [Deltaproteobacteria bacterium]
MGRVSQRAVAFDGIPIRTRVAKEVGQAIIAEALRLRRSADHTAAEILRQWYELDYLPSQKEKK